MHPSKFCSLLMIALGLVACGGGGGSNSEDTSTEISLNFKPIAGGMDVSCDTEVSGLGPSATYSAGFGDIRFFISNIRLYDNDGDEVEFTMDDNDFQLNHEDGSVALIDFSDTSEGFCELQGLDEGTPATNSVITGIAADAVSAVSFDVGVPQLLMKSVIGAGSFEDAPAPLNQLVWSWVGGYRHFIVNFSLMNAENTEMLPNGAFHIGSRSCGGNGGTGVNALEAQDECDFINTPHVDFDNFDPSSDEIAVDMVAFLANFSDENATAGMAFGLQCHSAPTQGTCVSLFPNFGIDMATGLAEAESNSVFTVD